MVMNSKSFNKLTGETGEHIGEHYLKGQGYQIVARNVRSPLGEIDLVAKHQKTLVFVEVKTRRSADFGLPEESITKRKKARLGRLASWYLSQHSISESEVRFDVLAVQLGGEHPEIRLIQNAFELRG